MTATWLDRLEADMIGAARKPAAASERWPTPGALAADLDPRIVDTPALRMIDAALVDLADTPDGRLIITMPPQEGKSQRCSRALPGWALRRNPDCRVAVVSYEHDVARRWGRQIRDDIARHPEHGLAVRSDLASQSEWELAGHLGGVYAVGIGGALTGRPVDLEVIDDPVKDRKQADSKAHRDAVWDWWLEVGSTRLAPGAPVVVILTRWHEDDLAGRLLAAEDGHLWRVLNIPAEADHDPAKGETDVLGRGVGDYLESARGRSEAQWAAIKVRSGSRTWASLYQGRPAPAAGGILHRGWWQFYDQPMGLARDDGSRWVPNVDELMVSWDMTFKDTAGTDFVCGQVWARRGADAYLVDQVLGRMDFVRTVTEFRMLAARWPQATLKLVEDKANGPAVIAMLRRRVPGIVPEEPQGSKVARAAAVSPLIEAGNVWLPDPSIAPWVAGFIEECAGFPNGAHDDQVDAMSQALNRLVLQSLLAGDVVTPDDLDDELADFGSYLPTA